MKYGISIKIDVTKIDKARLFHAKESGAKYLDLTTFIDTDVEGKFGDHGFITQQPTKEEREAKTQLPILGNTTVFWTGESEQQSAPQSQPAAAAVIEDGFSDEIPF